MTYHSLRPFWESDDEIDVGIISDILVVIFRYIPEEESIPIFKMCLDPSRSCAVKMCAVRALTLLSIEVWLEMENTIVFWRADSRHPEAQSTMAAPTNQSPRHFITSRPLCSHRKPCTAPRGHFL